ncbi:DUF456 domain-containing protein [Salinilacihabitans rarus]|uniref:DUF456 domain-containing protein n=1 Tax=Salinilacihabitans rarus TaxID=2961596 RepID=UPI0020C895A5|nr:DUF456 domain-containing protein [Salinilacihabitans rarus]
MSERSDEATRNREPDGPRSTDDLLDETDRLLSDAGTARAPADETDARGGDVAGATASRAPEGEADATERDSRLALSGLFSPKGFLAVVLVLGAGLLVGGTAFPFAGVGRFLGLGVAAFLVGLVGSRRRYLETAVAGASVGGVAATLDFVTVALLGGSTRTLVAAGAGAGALACLLGYYFGRDLRDGLTRDV